MRKLICALCTALALLSCGQREATSPIAFDDVLASRRSIRYFDASKTVSKEAVREILAAAQDAPSWANTQTTRYYVAISPEKVDAVRELIGERNKKNTEGVCAFIVSTFVKGRSGFFNGEQFNEVGDGWGAYDNGLNNAYLILKARAMGYDTLIMGMRDSDALRTLLGISDNEMVLPVIAIGHRAADPEKPSRKPLDEIARFF